MNILVEYLNSKRATMQEHIDILNHLQDSGLISDNALMTQDISESDAERVLPEAKTHLQKLRAKA